MASDYDQYDQRDADGQDRTPGSSDGEPAYVGKPGLVNMAFEIGLMLIYFQGVKVLCMPNKWALGWEYAGAAAAFLACVIMFLHGRSAWRKYKEPVSPWREAWWKVAAYSITLSVVGMVLIPVGYLITLMAAANAAGA